MIDLDITRPGPAGLFYRTDNLTASGWQQEHRARARLERWCSQCGQRAVYGYGETLTTDGVLSCADADCRIAAEAAANARSKLPVQDAREVSTDLFGAAA